MAAPVRIPRTEQLRHDSGDAGAPDTGAVRLSLVTWNILAPCYVEPARYLHVDPASLAWDHRAESIIDELCAAEADVVLLQEVMPSIFEEDLEPRMMSIGYTGIGPKGGAQLAGNATFFREDRLKLTWTEHRSRVLIVGLQPQAGGPEVVIANAHLEGNAREVAARVQQAKSVLQRASRRDCPHALILAGDFNAPLDSSAVASYLSFGCVVPGVIEFGWEVDESVVNSLGQDGPGHPYSLKSAYVPDGVDFSFTHRGSFGFCGMIDQIWFDHEALHCLGTRNVFRSSEHRADILARGLPHASDPSDHLPLGAVFQVLPEAPHRGPVGHLQQQSKSPDDQATEEDLAAEAALLWENCTLSDEQRAVWTALSKDVADATPSPGKRPSADELQALETAKAARDSFLSSLEAGPRQELERLLELRKAEKKARERAAKRQQQQQQQGNKAKKKPQK